MEKKLQVFISSTFLDLKLERQAAVQAILGAGHIPAGMELFSAGNETQLEVIKRWIDESDVYLLLLGGRYGSIEPKSKKSYTHLEFDYALEKNIPLFSLVITESFLDTKVKEVGKDVIELDNPAKLKEFRKEVTSKIIEYFDDTKDIQLGILKTLRDFEKRYSFDGWISGKNLLDNTELIKQNSALLEENRNLKEKLEVNHKTKNANGNDEDFKKIKNKLSEVRIEIPDKIRTFFDNKENLSVHEIVLRKKDMFTKGLAAASNSSELELFLFSRVAPKLIILGLMKEKNIYGKSFQRYVFTESGIEFFKNEILN